MGVSIDDDKKRRECKQFEEKKWIQRRWEWIETSKKVIRMTWATVVRGGGGRVNGMKKKGKGEEKYKEKVGKGGLVAS